MSSSPMTSRRIPTNDRNARINGEQNVLSAGASGQSNISPAVPTAVIYKLLGFTAAMIGAPIGTYFLTLNSVFRGSSTWAGAAAAIMANVVLVAYILVAFNEDQSERLAAEVKAKKGE